ncbi:MAG: hypothetical protein IJ048_12035 [Clostridia bacterium]|nr:hypothetical protein [Clostridia bacterium]
MPFEQSQWIWCERAASVNAYVLFRHRFSAGAGGARLFISADAQYAAFLNGALIGEGQYADYPGYKVYDELSCQTADGENALEITVWCPVTDSSVYRAGRPGLLFELTDEAGQVLAASGEATRCAPHPGYQSGPIENITPQLGYTFSYDARSAAPEWDGAVVVEGARPLHPRPVPKLARLPQKKGELYTQGVFFDSPGATFAEKMQFSPMAYRRLRDMTGLRQRPSLPSEAGVRFAAAEGDGLYALIDLMEEDAGFLSLDIELDDEAEILIGWGEHTHDLRLRTAVGPRNFAAHYMGRAGRNRFTHLLRRVGLRYVTLFVRAHAFTLHYAGILPTVYPVSGAPRFHVADRLHQRIYDASVRTLIACMHEHYEDCPWREQALYTMDSRNQMLCGYYALGEYAMPRASLRLMALGLRQDGLLELCAPARVPVTIPSFTVMFLVQLQEYHLFSGDGDFARTMLPTARAIAEKLVARIGDADLVPAWEGAEYWNFYEWMPGLDGHTDRKTAPGAPRYDAPMNAFAVLALRRLALLEQALGEDGSRWAGAADAVARAAHARFFDASLGYYRSYAAEGDVWGDDELTQALMVCADICSETCLDGVLASLSGGRLTAITLSYSIFQFDALMKRPETYARWVFDRIARDWGRMLYEGATTFWETQAGSRDFDDAGSLCHGWSAVPIYCYFAYALGLRPTAPGFKERALAPVDSGLYELSGRVQLPDGSLIDL